MSTRSQLIVRRVPHENHHLFNNHGTWWIRYSIRPAPWLKAQRIAESLETRCIALARHRRDRRLGELLLSETLLQQAEDSVA